MLRVLVVVFALAQPLSATCPNLCSGHGNCDIFSRCHCWARFSGSDCSEIECPRGRAWSDDAQATDSAHALAECSKRGMCDRSTGKCQCQSGFDGNACQRLECTNHCSGHGSCVNMKSLASQTRRSSDSAHFTYSERWDSSSFFGCICDEPYTGFDCSQRTCPMGDDPLTTGQVNEVQVFTCAASGGTLLFHFGGVSTEGIPHSASAAEVKAVLDRHPAIGSVDVTFHPASSGACLLCHHHHRN